MRITDILTESQLDELSLAGVGRGFGKAVSGVGKVVGSVKGAVQGTKDAYNRGRQTSYDAARSNVSGQRRPGTPPPGTPPPGTPPPGIPPPGTPPPPPTVNPFNDAAKLQKSFDAISQQLTAAQATQLKPIIQSIYRQLGGVSEGIGSNTTNKVMGRAPTNKYQVGQVVKYEMDPPQADGSGVGTITAVGKSGDHYKIDGSKIVNHFEIKGVK
jgi:hypothetical protein